MKKKEINIPESNCEDCPFHKHEVHDYWRCCIHMRIRRAHPTIGFSKPKWCKLAKVTLEENDNS